MLFTDHRLENFAKDPAVVRFGGRYFLYYTSKHADGVLGVGIAVSDDMEAWLPAGEIVRDCPCEKNGIAAPAAIVLDGCIHLFYQTYGNWRSDAICHAVSSDGVNFTKDAGNPVFRPTDDWCCGRAIDADVCVFDGRIFLYFATRDHEMRIQKVGGAYAALDSGFGKDAWTQITNGSLIAPELIWEGECIEAPATIVNGGRMYMFYGGSYNCKPQQIGCAVSDDGMFFRRLFSEKPFKPNGSPGSWNACESGHPYAFRDDDGRAYLFYQGSPDMGKSWYLSRMEIAFGEDGMPFILRDFSGDGLTDRNNV